MAWISWREMTHREVFIQSPCLHNNWRDDTRVNKRLAEKIAEKRQRAICICHNIHEDKAQICSFDYRWRKRAAIMVMRQRARHFNTMFHFKNKYCSTGRKQCLYIQIVKKCKFTHRSYWGGLHGWVVPNQMYGVTKWWSWRVKGINRSQYC